MRQILEAYHQSELNYRCPRRYYDNLHHDLQQFIPAARLIGDPLRTLAYGTDASLYRLIPKLVVRVDSEDEMRRILAAAHRHETPVTFHARRQRSLSVRPSPSSVLLRGRRLAASTDWRHCDNDQLAAGHRWPR